LKAIAFGTDGWRAVLADQFTVENVRVVAQAIAAHTREQGGQDQGVIVGHDTRFLGRMFAQEVVGVLTANGIRTYLVNEATPTPVVAFGVKHFAASGAVMITASHNPPEYNGIKYIPDYAGPATPVITGNLEKHIAAIQQSGDVRTMPLEEAFNGKRLQYIFLRPHYEAHLRRMVNFDVLKRANLSVVVDPMHGAGIGYLSSLLAEAGIETCSIRDWEDPLFGGNLPEPNDKHLSELKEEVIQRRAVLGLANDGDADRFGVVDRFGQYLSPNQVLLLLTRHLIKNRGLTGRIVRTVATTHMLDRIACQYGLDVTETPVGFKYVGAEMRKGDVLIGGEESGGASILGHIPEKDGILINLLVAEMCAWEQKGIDQILLDVLEEVGEVFHARWDFRLAEKDPWMERMLAQPPDRVGPFPVTSVLRTDGIKLMLAGGSWILIRPSGTEPLLRVYGETDTVAGLERIKDAVQEWFAEISA